ncbi:MAG TPA: urease subunit beta [Streptosporangiaceae bacterium]
MHLTPRERNRLEIFTAAELARRRRSRGRRLNVPEATALISDEVLECAWDGASLDEVIAHARSALGPDDVMDGVGEVLRHLEVEALFPSGTALVAVDDPIGTGPPSAGAPGAIRTPEGSLTVNAGRDTAELEVTNTGDETVFVSSHYHFFECNPVLEFDRRRALGMRLDIAAGTAVSWGPGERRRVRLVSLAGRAVAYGFRGLVQGPTGREAGRG